MRLKKRLARISKKQKMVIGISGGGCVSLILLTCCCGVVGYFGFGIGRSEKQQIAIEVGTRPPEVRNLGLSIPSCEVTSYNVRIIGPDEKADLNGIELQLMKGRVGRLELVSPGKKESTFTEEEYLLTTFRITNRTKASVPYYAMCNGPSAHFPDRLYLKDEFGNLYSAWFRKQGVSWPKNGILVSTKIEPGKSIEDVIAFDRPTNHAQWYLAVFPGKNLSRKESAVAFRIPRSWYHLD